MPIMNNQKKVFPYYPQYAVTSTYQGPGDVVSGAYGWWGLRAYSAAQCTGAVKSINVRRTSDNATTDILILSNGTLDTATLSTFLTATTGFVTTWYEQSGGGGPDLVQATTALQPQIILTGGFGSLPALLGNGTALLGGTITSQVQPYTFSFVAERTSSFTTIGNIGGNNLATVFLFGTSNTANTWRMSSGTMATFTASDSVGHAFQLIFNGTSSVACVDGSPTTVSAGTNATSGTTFQVIGLTAGLPFRGIIGEIGLWDLGFNSTQQTNMDTNQSNYWGV